MFQILKNCLKKREKYLKANKIEAFRLYDRGREYANIAIDVYRDNAVIHVFSRTSPLNYSDIEIALFKLLNIKKFFYKNRMKEDFALPVALSKPIVIEEYGHKFMVNFSEHMDTGLYLDHRETRKWIGEHSKNKIVLNTFAYTGSFSIYAAAGGAAKTCSVDLSKTYCDWIKKNLKLNSLSAEKNWVYKMDTMEFFQYAKRKNMTFDIIIIDPPTFSRNKGKIFSVQNDHPELINAALELLNPMGFILFSNNKQDFRLYKNKLSPCRIQNIQNKTIPPDFSQSNTHHCFLIRK